MEPGRRTLEEEPSKKNPRSTGEINYENSAHKNTTADLVLVVRVATRSLLLSPVLLYLTSYFDHQAVYIIITDFFHVDRSICQNY